MGQRFFFSETHQCPLTGTYCCSTGDWCWFPDHIVGVWVWSQLKGIFIGSVFGPGLDELGIFDQYQSKLSQHSNKTIVTEKNPAAAI